MAGAMANSVLPRRTTATVMARVPFCMPDSMEMERALFVLNLKQPRRKVAHDHGAHIEQESHNAGLLKVGDEVLFLLDHNTDDHQRQYNGRCNSHRSFHFQGKTFPVVPDKHPNGDGYDDDHKNILNGINHIEPDHLALIQEMNKCKIHDKGDGQNGNKTA